MARDRDLTPAEVEQAMGALFDRAGLKPTDTMSMFELKMAVARGGYEAQRRRFAQLYRDADALMAFWKERPQMSLIGALRQFNETRQD
jgi:hypothetical protein